MRHLTFLAMLSLPSIACTVVAANANAQLDVMQAPYNAKGDCSTDDTAALQSAITDGSGKAGVFLPPPPGGCYLVTRNIFLPSNVLIFGLKGLSKIYHIPCCPDPINDPLCTDRYYTFHVTANGTHNVTIRNLVFTTDRNQRGCDGLPRTDDDEAHFALFVGAAATSDITIDGNEFSNHMHASLRCNMPSERWKIVNNYVHDYGGFNSEGMNHSEIAHNTFTNLNCGLPGAWCVYTSGEGVVSQTIHHNTATTVAGGIKVGTGRDSQGNPLSNSNGIAISDNQFYNVTDEAAIVVYGVVGGVVANNTIVGSGSVKIAEGAEVGDLLIAGNSLTWTGVFLHGGRMLDFAGDAHDVQVIGNKFSAAGVAPDPPGVGHIFIGTGASRLSVIANDFTGGAVSINSGASAGVGPLGVISDLAILRNRWSGPIDDVSSIAFNAQATAPTMRFENIRFEDNDVRGYAYVVQLAAPVANVQIRRNYADNTTNFVYVYPGTTNLYVVDNFYERSQVPVYLDPATVNAQIRGNRRTNSPAPVPVPCMDPLTLSGDVDVTHVTDVTGNCVIRTIILGSPMMMPGVTDTQRLIADGTWATDPGPSGNIRPKTTSPRAPGEMVTFVHDPTTGLWYEQ